MNLQQQIEASNARGVGQFHIVKNGSVTATHRGYFSTVELAKRQKACVYNDSAEKIHDFECVAS